MTVAARTVAPADVVVTEVTTRSDEVEFVELPYRLHARDPLWVPPLRRMERRRWSSAHNPSLQSRWVCRFLAHRHGRVVGRIAAIIDHAFAERWSPDTGFFGFFECTDDIEVALALLARAEHALRERGASAVLGPVNLTTHDEVGLLVHGFDRAPRLLDPWNPRYYATLLELAGYRPAHGYDAWLWTPAQEPSKAVQRLLARCEDDAGITARSVDPRSWDSEVRLLHRLYNACFADLWGYVPISEDEMTARAAEFRSFYRPELVLIAEAAGEPCGFAITLPDVNRALARARGRLFPFGWLRIAAAIPRIRTTRFLLLGVVPAMRGRGVAPLLAGRMAEAGRRLGIQDSELSLVQTANDPMRRVIAAFGCPLVKSFRLYGRSLADPT
ncbi:MAG: GNAT family N-acetyltransferase [Longimicrobiales bacterium]